MEIIGNLLRRNPIVVTGLGSISAAGPSVEDLWNAVLAGRPESHWREFSGPGEIARRFPVCEAPVPDLSSVEWRHVRKMDRCVQLACVAAHAAWSQAGLSADSDPTRIGVVVGTSRGAVSNPASGELGRTTARLAPSMAAQTTFASLSGALSRHFGAEGFGATIAATCASSAVAIAVAAEQILLGKVDAMLVGGSETPLNWATLAQLDAAGVVGSHEDPRQSCRPFDSRRNGLVLGEGSGFLVLESERHAAGRGATPLARFLGWATSVDGSGRSGLKRDGSGLSKVMNDALQIAGLPPGMIDYINAHGTGTKLNDYAEAQSILGLFGERAPTLPCSSTKPVTGHCLGATPALEAVLCVEALRHQRFPPTANCSEPDPECPINMVPLVAPERAELSRVMSNSIGFWGYHASLIFGKPN